jgi:hypothetical protein
MWTAIRRKAFTAPHGGLSEGFGRSVLSTSTHDDAFSVDSDLEVDAGAAFATAEGSVRRTSDRDGGW